MLKQYHKPAFLEPPQQTFVKRTGVHKPEIILYLNAARDYKQHSRYKRGLTSKMYRFRQNCAKPSRFELKIMVSGLIKLKRLVYILFFKAIREFKFLKVILEPILGH